MTHTQEIEQSRTGGFGGSDAKMFYKVGTKGLSALSATDMKRIAVAKGLHPYKPIARTEAMQKGHDFEEWFANQSFCPIAQREVKISHPLSRNFEVFSHLDFYANDGISSEYWELKCVEKVDTAAKDHKAQLQWAHMLGVRNVWLIVCDSSKSFEEGTQFPIGIQRDQKYIDTMLHGIKLIDEAWESFTDSDESEMSEAELLPFDRKDVLLLTSCFQQIKAIEKQAEELKERIRDFMEKGGIKSIKSENYTIVYQPESEAVTFDKEKLFKTHPELREEDFQKVNKRKSHIKITLI